MNTRRLAITPEVLVGMLTYPITMHLPTGDRLVVCEGMPLSPVILGGGVDERDNLYLDLLDESFDTDEPLTVYCTQQEATT